MTKLPAPSVRGVGPVPAKIAIVTEYATADDLWKGYPLAGSQGDFFSKLLHEAGILRSECYITPVLKTRPAGDNPNLLYTQTKSTAQKLGLTEVLHNTWVHPSLPPAIASLHEELALVSPTAVIALGDLAMFALTGQYGSVDTWRGSIMESLGVEMRATHPPAAPHDGTALAL
jgi:uracil-DNA glycosylase